MSTLAEIEVAADSLSVEDKGELLRFLVMQLHQQGSLPALRLYADDELASMIAEDEADGLALRSREALPVAAS